MKDLKFLLNECITELNYIGIDCGKIRNIEINIRAKSRWGLCRTVKSGVYDIEISSRLLEDNVKDIVTKNTIIHELLHTVKGCHGHTGKWKVLAEYVNKKLPQYNIKRTARSEEKGIETEAKEPTYRYAVQCTKCGQIIRRQKMSKLIQHPQRYRCAKCGGKLKLVNK